MDNPVNLAHLRRNLLRLARGYSDTGRTGKRLISAAVDALMVVVALWLSYSLLLGSPFTEFRKVWLYFLVLPVTTCIVFAYFGIYRWVVRSVNLSLQLQIVKGCIVSAGVLTVLMFMFPPISLYTRSAVVIYFILLLPATLLSRQVWKYLMTANIELEQRVPVGIYGAGVAGQRLASMMFNSGAYSPVFFIEDDEQLWGSRVSGLPVVGGQSADLRELVTSSNLSLVILALPSISEDRHRAIVSELSTLGIAVKTVPSIEELVAGHATLSDIRDVTLTDVLGRAEVTADAALLAGRVSGKNVLVTGGGGSIGSEICRQILQLNPASLLVLDQSEKNLYDLTEELNAVIEARALELNFVPVLGSVLDKVKVTELLANYNINTVYHAAAYKHVPIVEQAPEEGVRINVFGTRTVLEASEQTGVESFVLVSTDKAVRPANVMGATKRLAEMVLQARAVGARDMAIGMVRFGNVLGSSGSVIPKFRAQINAGGPVTVTDPEVTRFFMTIPEASQLVLQASSLMRGGEVFVLDMGEPVLIRDLAGNMIDLMGKQSVYPDRPGYIPISYTGLRPGEKLYEELFISPERKNTVVEKIFVDRDDFIAWPELQRHLDELDAMLKRNASDEIAQKLFSLIDLSKGVPQQAIKVTSADSAAQASPTTH